MSIRDFFRGLFSKTPAESADFRPGRGKGRLLSEGAVHPLVSARTKLGGGWATRKLTARSRAKRIASLTPIERLFAQAAGWLPGLPHRLQ